MARVDVDRMRRYAERGEEETAEQERRRWLAGLTPEHRAKHESGAPIILCSDCMAETMAALDRSLAKMAAFTQSIRDRRPR